MQELLKTSLPMATTRGLVRAKENNRSLFAVHTSQSRSTRPFSLWITVRDISA